MAETNKRRKSFTGRDVIQVFHIGGIWVLILCKFVLVSCYPLWLQMQTWGSESPFASVRSCPHEKHQVCFLFLFFWPRGMEKIDLISTFIYMYLCAFIFAYIYIFIVSLSAWKSISKNNCACVTALQNISPHLNFDMIAWFWCLQTRSQTIGHWWLGIGTSKLPRSQPSPGRRDPSTPAQQVTGATAVAWSRC